MYNVSVTVAGQLSNTRTYSYVSVFRMTNVTVGGTSASSLATVGGQSVVITGGVRMRHRQGLCDCVLVAR